MIDMLDFVEKNAEKSMGIKGLMLQIRQTRCIIKDNRWSTPKFDKHGEKGCSGRYLRT